MSYWIFSPIHPLHIYISKHVTRSESILIYHNSLVRPRSPSSARSRQLPRSTTIAVERAVLTTSSFGHDRRQARGLDNSLVCPQPPSSTRSWQLPRSAAIAVEPDTPSSSSPVVLVFERFGVLSATRGQQEMMARQPAGATRGGTTRRQDDKRVAHREVTQQPAGATKGWEGGVGCVCVFGLRLRMSYC